VSPTSTSRRPPELKNAREAVSTLADAGPHEVLRGDLGMIGVPGVVYTPAEGLGLPAVAFGHDWLQPVARYAGLLRHLASWGIVVAAPDSHRGALPSHVRFAADLRTALDVCVGVRLGEGRISVDGRRTALAGHGIGGGVALLAAADVPRLAAVVTLAVAQTRPSALDAARRVTVPTLHIAAERDTVSPVPGHAEPIAAAAGGPVWLRTLRKADHTGFLDGRHWSDLLLTGGPNGKTRRLTRALTTAFLLHHLAGEDRGDVLVGGKVKGTELVRGAELRGAELRGAQPAARS
jgi:dienelactone hydrolase